MKVCFKCRKSKTSKNFMCIHLLCTVWQGVPQWASSGDDDRGLVVCTPEILGVWRPVRPVGCQTCFVTLGRRGFLPPDWNRHGDNKWNKVVVSRSLRVHNLLFCGTPWPVWLLIEMKIRYCNALYKWFSFKAYDISKNYTHTKWVLLPTQ